MIFRFELKISIVSIFILLRATSQLLATSDLVFDQLSVDQGLSNAEVTAILQDSRGYLWIGTLDGMNRWDGYQFTWFQNDPLDNQSISGNRITAIYEDVQERIWIGTKSGLNCFDPGTETFTRFRHDPKDSSSLVDDWVWAVSGDREGNLWLGTSRGICRLKAGSNQFDRTSEGLDEQGRSTVRSVWVINQDDSGRIYAGTNRGLFQVDQKSLRLNPLSFPKNRSSNPLSSMKIQAVEKSNQSPDVFWVGTTEGLYRYTYSKNEIIPVSGSAHSVDLSRRNITALFEDNQGYLWLGSDTGIYRYSYQEHAWQRFTCESDRGTSIPCSYITSIYQDQGRVIWFGTWGEGLGKYAPSKNKFKNYFQLEERGIQAIYLDHKDVLWLGTMDGMVRFDRQSGQIRRFLNPSDSAPGLQDNEILSIHLSSDGNLWIGTYGGGVSVYDPSGDMWIQTSLSNPSIGAVNAFYEDPVQGRIWIGTGKGLFRYDRRTQQGEFVRGWARETDLLKNVNVTAVIPQLKENSSTLWLGTWNHGLVHYDPVSGRAEQFLNDPNDPDSLNSNSIFCLMFDYQGDLWVGTYGGGLDRFKIEEEHFEHYTSASGLPSNSVVGVLEDQNHDLWMSTLNGVVRFTPSNGKIRVFDEVDGLQDREFTQNAYFKSPGGEIFFAGEGLNSFFPADIQDDPYAPRIVLTELRKLNRPVPVDPTGSKKKSSESIPSALNELDRLVLTHRDYLFSIGFSALSFSAPEKNQYAYTMEGFDQDWILTDAGNRIATYTNLPPGQYTFRVKASNQDQIWNDTGTSLQVMVTPPFWKTSWAYAVYVFSLLLLIWAAYQIRVRTLIKRQKELSRLVQVRTRELALANSTLENTILELREANDLKSKFLSIASHDLKNPLQAIFNYSEFLKRRVKNDPRAFKCLSSVERLIRGMLDLITNLLDHAALEAGKISFHKIPQDLGQIADDTIRLLQDTADQKQQRIELGSSGDLRVWVDEMAIRQILNNLISNALKYSTAGKTTRVHLERRNEHIVISVRDEGPGLSEAEKKKVFKKFHRLSPKPTGDESSTGLGLYITKELVELHGGNIRLETQVGSGCQFIVELPAFGD